MGNIPGVHEVSTSFLSLGDAIAGDPEKARERWKTYAEESIIGSSVDATVQVCKGNEEKSLEYLKGMGRATGKAVLGGGLLKDVPVFHEVAVCGESLGDMIGGGDDESARERWKTYSQSSVIGSGVRALAATIAGDDEEAKRLADGFGRAGARFGVTAAATVGAAVATGGLAAPLGVPAAAAIGAIVRGAAEARSTAEMQLIDNDKIDDPGTVVGMGLFGTVSGTIHKHAETAQKAAKAAEKSSEEASRSSEEASKGTSCANPESTSSFNENQTPDKPTPSSDTRSSKPNNDSDPTVGAVVATGAAASGATGAGSPKRTSSSKQNQAPDKPIPPSGTSSSNSNINSDAIVGAVVAVGGLTASLGMSAAAAGGATGAGGLATPLGVGPGGTGAGSPKCTSSSKENLAPDKPIPPSGTRSSNSNNNSDAIVGAVVAVGGLAASLGVSAAAASGATGAGCLAAPLGVGLAAPLGVGAGGTGVGSPKSTSSSKENQAPDKPTPPSDKRFSKPKNNSKRPRAQSYSVYQEAEHFPQDNSTTEHEMSGQTNFSYNGGKAQRNSKFPDVWDPKDSGSMLDRKAAEEAARRDVESSVKNLSNKNRPGMITVSKDLETGSTTSSASVKGKIQQRKFGRKMRCRQKRAAW